MRITKYLLAVVLGVIALMVPRAARADDVTVTANLTFDTCAQASGCQETFDITYGWDNTTNTLASPVVITATGDLGSDFFSDVFVGGKDPVLGLVPPNDVLIYAANDPLDDLLVLTLSETGSSLAPGTYTETNTITGSGQFRTSLNCGAGDGPICASGNISPSTAEVTVSAMATPEPSALVLLGIGLLALLGIKFARKEAEATAA